MLRNHFAPALKSNEIEIKWKSCIKTIAKIQFDLAIFSDFFFTQKTIGIRKNLRPMKYRFNLRKKTTLKSNKNSFSSAFIKATRTDLHSTEYHQFLFLATVKRHHKLLCSSKCDVGLHLSSRTIEMSDKITKANKPIEIHSGNLWMKWQVFLFAIY